jgi:tetratricopeptide (TPR) repeat protein
LIMLYEDHFALRLRASSAAAVAAYDSALSKLLLLRNDPMAEVNEVIRLDAQFPMAHVLKAVMCVLSTDRALLPEARAALASGRMLAQAEVISNPVYDREQAHLAALALWIDGHLNQACAHWEAILIDYPNDALAMFAAHQTDFFLGDTRALRDRVARRLPDVVSDSSLQGHYKAMHAFGLEEMGDYAAAESSSRAALEQNPQEAWAVHALAHVLEMTNRIDEGIAWIETSAQHWAGDSFFAGHLWWHQALFYCDRQDWSAVLRLYDERLRVNDSAVIMDLLDASALLWRLQLHGVSVGKRWHRLCELWEPRLDDAWYAFNDWHALMAFVGAGRDDLASRLLSAMERSIAAQAPAERSTSRRTDNDINSATVGLPVARGLYAFANRQFVDACSLLAPMRAIAFRAGGSHAQRDLIDQTLLAAAEQSGQYKLARALLNERLALKPRSVLNLDWLSRIPAA